MIGLDFETNSLNCHHMKYSLIYRQNSQEKMYVDIVTLLTKTREMPSWSMQR